MKVHSSTNLFWHIITNNIWILIHDIIYNKMPTSTIVCYVCVRSPNLYFALPVHHSFQSPLATAVIDSYRNALLSNICKWNISIGQLFGHRIKAMCVCVCMCVSFHWLSASFEAVIAKFKHICRRLKANQLIHFADWCSFVSLFLSLPISLSHTHAHAPLPPLNLTVDLIHIHLEEPLRIHFGI